MFAVTPSRSMIIFARTQLSFSQISEFQHNIAKQTKVHTYFKIMSSNHLILVTSEHSY